MSSSIPLLSTEAHARVGCLPVSVCILHSFCRSRIARGLLSFPCLDRVRVVVAPRVRMLPLGVFGYLPFIYGLAAAGFAACGSGTRDPLFGDGVVSVRGGAGA